MADPPADLQLWRERVATLAKLAQADGLAVILLPPNQSPVSYATHNLGEQTSWPGSMRQALDAMVAKRAPVIAPAAITLADGRGGRSLLCAPIEWRGRVIGGLVALRVDFAFDPDETPILSTIAALVGLDLAASSRQLAARPTDDARLRRAIDDRRHAITLYEVARLSAGRRSTLGDGEIAEVIAKSLSCDVVGIWTNAEDDQLVRSWSYGYPQNAPQRVPLGPTLARLLDEGIVERMTRLPAILGWNGLATDAIVAPVGANRLLIVGRRDAAFSDAELQLAPSLAEAIDLRHQPPEANPPIAAPSAPAPLAAPEFVTEAHIDEGLDEELEREPDLEREPEPEPLHEEAQPAVPSSRSGRRGIAVSLLAIGLLLGASGFVLATPVLYAAGGALVLLALLILAF